MKFEILGEISQIEPIATGFEIRDRRRLVREYGRGNWRKVKGLATVRLESGEVVEAELHWYEAHGIGRKKSRSRNSGEPARRSFAICVRNDGYRTSLELRRVYEVLGDAVARRHGLLRVIDESGEDYLYSADYFVPLSLPRTVEATLRRISRRKPVV